LPCHKKVKLSDILRLIDLNTQSRGSAGDLSMTSFPVLCSFFFIIEEVHMSLYELIFF